MPKPDTFRFKLLTGTGLAYLAGGLVFLCLGLIRGELAASISGIALLSFLLFSALLAVLSRILWRNASFSAEWKDDGLFCLRMTGNPKKRYPSLCFTELMYCIDYRSSVFPGMGRFFSLRVPVTAASAEYRPVFPPRGIYTASNPHLEIRDHAGFFSFRIDFPGTDITAPLTVLPAPQAEPRAGIPPGKTGLTRGKSAFKRSEDLYETRNYQPGDDPRKINWKVYAHTGELSIRQGELLPPPADEYVFVLYTGIPGPPSGRTKDLFDLLLSRAVRLAENLLERNRTVTVITCDNENHLWSISIHPSDTGATETARKAFSVPQLCASILPAERFLSTAPDQATLLLFALPEQLSGPVIPRSFSTRTTVYLGPVSDPHPPESTIRKILGLLFVKPTEDAASPADRTLPYLAETETRLKQEGFNVKKI